MAYAAELLHGLEIKSVIFLPRCQPHDRHSLKCLIGTLCPVSSSMLRTQCHSIYIKSKFLQLLKGSEELEDGEVRAGSCVGRACPVRSGQAAGASRASGLPQGREVGA